MRNKQESQYTYTIERPQRKTKRVESRPKRGDDGKGAWPRDDHFTATDLGQAKADSNLVACSLEIHLPKLVLSVDGSGSSWVVHEAFHELTLELTRSWVHRA
jgi:hypothetical protein